MPHVTFIRRRNTPLRDRPYGSMPGPPTGGEPDWQALAADLEEHLKQAGGTAVAAQIVPITVDGTTGGLFVVQAEAGASVQPMSVDTLSGRVLVEPVALPQAGMSIKTRARLAAAEGPTQWGVLCHHVDGRWTWTPHAGDAAEPSARLRAEIGIACAGLTAEQLKVAQRIAGERLTREFGGCTVLPGKGFWAENGQSAEGPYVNPAIEDVIWILVSVMPSQRAVLQSAITSVAQLLNEQLGTGIQHVHCELWSSHAGHVDMAGSHGASDFVAAGDRAEMNKQI